METGEQNDSFSWQASEFIHHEKDFSWYAGVSLVGVLLIAGLVVFVDIISAIVVAVMTAAFLLYAKRQPRVLTYTLTASGLTIGQKHYQYEDFTSFTIREEGAYVSAQLIPVKRFMPAISIYFSQEDGPRIVDILADKLPHDDRQPDVVDRFFERLRF